MGGQEVSLTQGLLTGLTFLQLLWVQMPDAQERHWEMSPGFRNGVDACTQHWVDGP